LSGVAILARDKEFVMKMLFILVPVLALCLFAADPWQSTPFAQWTDQEVQQIMSNSPWAHEVTVTSGSQDTIVVGGGGRRGGISGGGSGSGGMTSTRMVVVWESALPVREAVLRVKYGEAIGSMNTKQTLETDDPTYVIIVNNIPATAVKGDIEKVKQDIKKRTTLNKLQPTLVELGVNGKVAGLYFEFPKTAPISLNDSDVDFSTKVGELVVKTRFHLQDMVLNGKLEL
jgi:hypothetical protein